MSGILSLVGTPIGNLADASPRATATLAAADVLCCEDTRVAGKLLQLLGIAREGGRPELLRCDEHVLVGRVPELLARVEAGERVAFVSDAGMPGISDPGQRLVDAALDAGLPVEVVPGPSAVVCALVASGLPSEHFFFEGFLPRKAGAMAARLAELVAVPGSLVFYESPRRAASTCASLADAYPGRRAALVRELTKLHEEVVRAPLPELAAELAAREAAGGIKGECVFVVEPPVAGEARGAGLPADASTPTLEQALAEARAAGESPSVAAKRIAKQFHLRKSDIYQQLVG